MAGAHWLDVEPRVLSNVNGTKVGDQRDRFPCRGVGSDSVKRTVVSCALIRINEINTEQIYRPCEQNRRITSRIGVPRSIHSARMGIMEAWEATQAIWRELVMMEDLRKLKMPIMNKFLTKNESFTFALNWRTQPPSTTQPSNLPSS